MVLYEGDCLDLLSPIPTDTVKLAVTSPPYNLGKPYGTRGDLDTYVAEQTRVVEVCVGVVSENGSICWQVGNYVGNGAIVPLDILRNPNHLREICEVILVDTPSR